MEERKLRAMPLFCPECGNVMKVRLDKKMWAINQKCLKCTVAEEGKIRAQGKEVWEEYQAKKMEDNMLSYLEDQKQHAEEYLKGLEKIEYLQMHLLWHKYLHK